VQELASLNTQVWLSLIAVWSPSPLMQLVGLAISYFGLSDGNQIFYIGKQHRALAAFLNSGIRVDTFQQACRTAMPSGGREAECSRNSARNRRSRRCGVCGRRRYLDYCLIRSFRPIRVPTALECFPPCWAGGHSSTSASAVMYDARPRQHSHSLP
jgi:hypothetical protein